MQKPQENEFVWQLNAASLLWHPFSKAGLLSEEAASFHWSLPFRGTKVRSEDSVSCWAPFAECSESSVLSEHANTCTEVLVLNKRDYFQASFPPLFPSQITVVLPPANTAHHKNPSLARHQFTVGAARAQSNTCFHARRMLLSSGTDCHVLANVRAECSLGQVRFCKAEAVTRKVHARCSTVWEEWRNECLSSLSWASIVFLPQPLRVLACARSRILNTESLPQVSFCSVLGCPAGEGLTVQSWRCWLSGAVELGAISGLSC